MRFSARSRVNFVRGYLKRKIEQAFDNLKMQKMRVIYISTLEAEKCDAREKGFLNVSTKQKCDKRFMTFF